ncbi:hypothetical protein RQP46_000317 [Phenoliferia psychrophenolica]
MLSTGTRTPQTGERTPLLGAGGDRHGLRPSLSYASLALQSSFSVSNESAFTIPGVFTPVDTISRDEEGTGELVEADEEPPLRDDLWVILGAMWVGSFLSALDGTVVATCLGIIGSEFSVSNSIGWLGTSRWAFLIQVICALHTFMVLWKVENSFSSEYVAVDIGAKIKRVDFAGSALLVTAVGALLTGLSLGGNTHLWRDPLVWGTLTAGVLLVVVFVLFETFGAKEPLISPQLLFTRTPAFASLTNWFSSMAQFAMLYTVPLWFAAVKGQSNSLAGAHLIPNVVSTSVTSLAVGYIMSKTGRYRVMLFWSRDSTPELAFWLSMAPGGLGYGGILTITLVALISAVPPSAMAQATGGSYLFRATGSVLGISISSAILQGALRRELPLVLTGPGSEDVIGKILVDIAAIKELEPILRDSVVGALEISDGVNSCSASMDAAILPTSDDGSPSSPPRRCEVLYLSAWHRVPDSSNPIRILACSRSNNTTPTTIFGNLRKPSSANPEVKETLVLLDGPSVFDLLSLVRCSDGPAARVFADKIASIISLQPERAQPLFIRALLSSLTSQVSLVHFLARSSASFAHSMAEHLTTSDLAHLLTSFDFLIKTFRAPLSTLDVVRDQLTDRHIVLVAFERVLRLPARKVAKGNAVEAPVDPYSWLETAAFGRVLQDPSFGKPPVEKAVIEEYLAFIRPQCAETVEAIAAWLFDPNTELQAEIDRVFLSSSAAPPTPPRAQEPAPKAKQAKVKKVLAPRVLAPPVLQSGPSAVQPKSKRNRAPTNDGAPLASVVADPPRPPAKKAMKSHAKASHARALSVSTAQRPSEVAPEPLTVAVVPAGSAKPRPLAPPPIMPLRAARLFDGSNFGAWQIVLSSRAIREWHSLKVTLQTVEKMLKYLSEGVFDGDNQKRLVGGESEVIIYEAKLLGDLRLVYQIDLEDGAEGESVKQIIRIWGIETHATLDKRVWQAVSLYTGHRGAEYRRRTNVRQHEGVKSEKRLVPASFPAVADAPVGVVEVGDLTDAQKLQIHDLLALSKHIPYSIGVARAVLAQDEEAVHLFQLSPLEKTVVYFPSSAFVIGRSGTGKTTSILLRILSYQKSQEQSPEILAPSFLRQIFITQSNLLASKVHKYYQQIWRTFATAGLTQEQATRLAQERAKAAAQDADLEDFEDDSAGLRGLPSRFSELTAEHFPLFISWDTLLILLENDYDIKWGGTRKRSEGFKAAFKPFKLGDGVDVLKQLGVAADFADDIDEGEGDESAPVNSLWDRYVDADVFAAWFKTFDQKLTKGIEPALCWSEILGIIEGSEEAVNTPNGALSEEQYLKLSERAHSTYVSHRPAIYAIYVAYRTLRNSRKYFDRSQRTHKLIRRLSVDPLALTNQIHHVSVDEAQDLLLADFRLLRYLCANPNGWIWAGDTAQTIASGSSFRFDDLKAAMYRQEVIAADLQQRESVAPEIFKLSLNYRSHCGITRLADSLVQAILGLFPNSIDSLPPEQGIVDGPAPVWIVPGDQDGPSRSFSSFLFGDDGAPVEFGAEQCILVRDEAARDALRRRTGDLGIILTIAESKGLEFTDCLLYDFFSDSAASASEWRVVLNLFKEPGEGVPTFDPVRHAIIAAELKFLYVASTRARNILWLADRDTKGDTVKQYFDFKKVIKICHPADPLPLIAASSSPEQWRKQGRNMFNKKLYKNAAFCYDKGDAPVEKEIAEAFEARQVLRSTMKAKGGKVDLGATAVVAAKFKACAETTASLWFPCAKLYLDARKKVDAAQAFELAGDLEQAASLFLGLGKAHIDSAVRIVRTGDPAIAAPTSTRTGATVVTASTREKVLKTARLHYLKIARPDKARELFETDDDLLEYMTDFDFDDARRSFYLSAGRFADAAQLDFAAGSYVAAAELYRKANDVASQVKCLALFAAEQLPLGSEKTLNRPARAEAAQRAVADATSALELDSSISLSRYRESSAAYLDVNAIMLLAVDAAKRGDKIGQFHCLDTALKVHPDLTSPSSVRRWLLEMRTYIALATNLVTSPTYSDDALRLLGRLETRLTEISNSLLAYPACRLPCVEFSLSGACTTEACQRRHVVDAKEHTRAALIDRIDILQLVQSLLPAYDMIASRLPASSPLDRQRVKNQQAVQQASWDSVLTETLFPPHPFAGGLMDVEPTPEFADMSRKLSIRNQDILFRISPKSKSAWEPLLPAAIVAAEFASEFGSYSSRIPIFKAPTLREFYLGRDPTPTTANLLTFLSVPPTAHLPGDLVRNACASVRTIFERGLDVDLSVLIHIAEDLGAISLLRARFGAVNELSWDGIVAPRGILQRLYRRHSERTVVDFSVNTKMDFVRLLGGFAHHIYDGSTYLRYRQKPLPGTGFMRHTFVLRLIRAMILLGSRSPPVRPVVLETLAKVRSDAGPRAFSPLTSGAYKAKTFNQLMTFLTTASNPFALDRMLFLDLSNSTPPEGVLAIRSRNLAGIENGLFTTLSARAKVFVPRSQVAAAQPPPPSPAHTADGVDEEETKEDVLEISAEEAARLRVASAIESDRVAAAAKFVATRALAHVEAKKLREAHDSDPFIESWKLYASFSSRLEGDALVDSFDQMTLSIKLRKTLATILEPIELKPPQPSLPKPLAKPLLTNGRILDLRVHLVSAIETNKAVEALLIDIHGALSDQDLALRSHFELGAKGILTLPKARVQEPKAAKPELGDIDGVEVEGDLDDAEEIGRRIARDL